MKIDNNNNIKQYIYSNNNNIKRVLKAHIKLFITTTKYSSIYIYT